MADIPEDPSRVPSGLPSIFEQKMAEHHAMKTISDAGRDFDEDMAERRRTERAAVADARHAGHRNPASKKARARARRTTPT